MAGLTTFLTAVYIIAVKSLGCKMAAPFMTLSFISLPTVPQLGLTDMGLVDVINHKLVDIELS